jgi:hypothetical protein
MKKFLPLTLILLLFTVILAQASIWFDGTFAEATSLAQEENKLIIIDFSSDF